MNDETENEPADGFVCPTENLASTPSENADPANNPRTTYLRYPRITDLIALMTVPVFAALFSELLLQPVGIDAWVYYAYGTDFSPLLASYGWTYYASRLPWNIIVGLYFWVFSPSVANFLLGLCVSCLGSFSLYSILRCYYSRSAAFLAAFAIASNSWYLGDTFWLYVDGPVIATSLFAIASFLHGLRGGTLFAFCLSGFAFTISINVHPIALFLILPSFGYILIAERAILQRTVWQEIIAFCVAAIMTMLALCTTGWLAFGNFWFFETTVSSAEWVVSGGWHKWVVPFSTWIRGATAFLMPIGVLLAGIIVFWRDAIRRELKSDAWIFGYAIFFGLCVVFSDGLMNAGRLQHTYYFIYLWIPTFLLFGSVVARLLDTGRAQLTAALVGGCLVALATLSLGGEYWRLHLAHPARLTAITYVIVAILFLLFIGAVILRGSRRGFPQVVGVIAGVAFIATSTAADDRVGTTAADERVGTVRMLWQSPATMAGLETTVDAQRFIETNLDANRKPLIWYDAKSEAQWELTAISSTFLFEYSALNRAMPTLTDTDLQKMDRPAVTVLLSEDVKDATRALDVLRERGLVERVVAKTRVGPVWQRINLWMVDTRSTAEASKFASSKFLSRTSALPADIARPLPIDWKRVVISTGSNSVTSGHWPLTIMTPPQPWSYGAVLPFTIGTQNPASPYRVKIKAHILEGKAGFGLLNHAENAFVQREFFSASPDPITLMLSSSDGRDVGPVVIQTAESAGPAKVVIDAIDVVTELAPVPLSVDWGKLERPTAPPTSFPIDVHTPAQPAAIGAIIPCQITQVPKGAPLWIIVRARVIAGEATVGLLDENGETILSKTALKALDESRTITLEATGGAKPIRLVVQNGASTEPATITIQAIDAGTMP